MYVHSSQPSGTFKSTPMKMVISYAQYTVVFAGAEVGGCVGGWGGVCVRVCVFEAVHVAVFVAVFVAVCVAVWGGVRVSGWVVCLYV